MGSLTIIVISQRTLLRRYNMQGVECAWASLASVRESYRRNQVESPFAAKGSEGITWVPYEDYQCANQSLQDEYWLNARQISQCNVS